MNEIRPPYGPAGDVPPDPDLTDTRPTVLVAPELAGRRDYTVVREPDDTDADYQARVNLFALLLDHAEKE